MNAAIAAIIAFLPTLAQIAQGAGVAVKVVAWLEELVPLVINGAVELYQPIKTLIADLRGTGQLTADDLAALDAYEAQIDAKFEEAAKKAQAEDDADQQAKPAT